MIFFLFFLDFYKNNPLYLEIKTLNLFFITLSI